MRENSITVNRNAYPYHDSISLRANEQQIGRYYGLDELTTRDERNQTRTAFGRNLRAQVQRYWYNGPYDQPQNPQFRAFERNYGANKNGRLWIPREANRATLLNELPGDKERRRQPRLPAVDPRVDPSLFIARSIGAMARAFGVESGADDCALIGALVDATRDRHPDGDVLYAPESFDAVIRRTGTDYRDEVELPILASRGGRDTALYFFDAGTVSKNLAQNIDFVARLFVEVFVSGEFGNPAGSGRLFVQYKAASQVLYAELNGSMYARRGYINAGYVNPALGVLVNFAFPHTLDATAVADSANETVFGLPLPVADLNQPTVTVLYGRLNYIWQRLNSAETDVKTITADLIAADAKYNTSTSEENMFALYSLANKLARLKTAPFLRSSIARTLGAYTKAVNAEKAEAANVVIALAKQTQDLATEKAALPALVAAFNTAKTAAETPGLDVDDQTIADAALLAAKTPFDEANERVKNLEAFIAVETTKALQKFRDEVTAKADEMRTFTRNELLDPGAQQRLFRQLAKKNIEFYPQVAATERYETLVGVATALLVAAELRALTFPDIVSSKARYPNMTREFQARRHDEAEACADEIEAATSALQTRDLGRLAAFASAPSMIFLNTPGGARQNPLNWPAVREKFTARFNSLRAEWRI